MNTRKNRKGGNLTKRLKGLSKKYRGKFRTLGAKLRKTKSNVRKSLSNRFERALEMLQNMKTRSKRFKRGNRSKRGGGFSDLFRPSAPISVNNDRVPLLGRLDGNTYVPAQTGYRSR